MPKGSRAAGGGRVAAASSSLLVLLRGEAFRMRHFSRQYATNPSPQVIALHALQSSVAGAASARGWNAISTCVDVVCAPHYETLLRAAVNTSLSRTIHAVRTLPEPMGESQSASLRASLEWCTSRPALPSWTALLVLRVDALFFSKLPLPSPTDMDSDVNQMWVPFRNRRGTALSPMGLPRVSDVLLLVPRARFPEILRGLAAHPYSSELHSLCDWLAKADSGAPRQRPHSSPMPPSCGTIRYLVETEHDSNTDTDPTNPLYRLVREVPKACDARVPQCRKRKLCADRGCCLLHPRSCTAPSAEARRAWRLESERLLAVQN